VDFDRPKRHIFRLVQKEGNFAMRLEENIALVRKQRAQSEAQRVANDLCLEFPHELLEVCHDAAQDALFDWCEELDLNKIFEPDYPYSWLYRSARGHLLNYQKRELHLARLEAIVSEPSHEPEANDWEYGRDFVQSLFAAGLDPHERATVRIKTAFGQSWNEIAAHRIDGKSPDALRQTYHRAIKKMKQWAKTEKARAEGKIPPPTFKKKRKPK
jgi:DNA-directed RNA polymerase specialized sigma24 family protein